MSSVRLALVAAAALLLVANQARAVGILIAPEDKPILMRVTVTILEGGQTSYLTEGTIGRLVFTGKSVYDPRDGETKATLTQPNGNTITSRAICSSDPWQSLWNGYHCSGQVSAKGDFARSVAELINNMEAPASAAHFSTDDRRRVKSLYDEQVKFKARQKLLTNAAAKAPASSLHFATPTPQPKVASVAGVTKTGGLVGGPSQNPVRPLYGAVYTDGTPAVTMTAGQTLGVSVTVQNTSSRTWPSGGTFHLAYHWYRGTAEIVHDGNRTFMPISVAPGATINLITKVTAPPSVGGATLRWDMVEENVAWFSDMGVPMSALHNVNVVP